MRLDLDVIARGTPAFSGADLANLVNEAAMVAVRDDRRILTAEDFDSAHDRILLGHRVASNAPLREEKSALAVHESGHSLVAVLCPHAHPVAKVTILPAGQALTPVPRRRGHHDRSWRRVAEPGRAARDEPSPRAGSAGVGLAAQVVALSAGHVAQGSGE